MKAKRSLSRLVASVVMAAAASTGVVVVSAGTADAAICGQYVYNKTRYYNHCGSGNVQVRLLEFLTPIPDYICVSPGTTYIGPKWRYLDATSTRKSC